MNKTESIPVQSLEIFFKLITREYFFVFLSKEMYPKFLSNIELFIFRSTSS